MASHSNGLLPDGVPSPRSAPQINLAPRVEEVAGLRLYKRICLCKPAVVSPSDWYRRHPSHESRRCHPSTAHQTALPDPQRGQVTCQLPLEHRCYPKTSTAARHASPAPPSSYLVGAIGARLGRASGRGARSPRHPSERRMPSGDTMTVKR